jgi:hypothetical protein
MLKGLFFQGGENRGVLGAKPRDVKEKHEDC